MATNSAPGVVEKLRIKFGPQYPQPMTATLIGRARQGVTTDAEVTGEAAGRVDVVGINKTWLINPIH